jgi:hypothetical protein
LIRQKRESLAVNPKAARLSDYAFSPSLDGEALSTMKTKGGEKFQAKRRILSTPDRSRTYTFVVLESSATAERIAP